MVNTAPLSEQDKSLLKNQITAEEKGAISQILAAFFFLIFFIFFPDRYSHRSLYQEYGFLWPFCISYGIFTVSFVYWKYKVFKNLSQDIAKGMKINQFFAVLKKERTFGEKKFFIWLDTPIKSFQKFSLLQEEYNQVEVGSQVMLEFTPKSMVLLNRIIVRTEKE